MTNYRRNFAAGGSFFFTVNLAERRLRLLTEHIDELRGAFRTAVRSRGKVMGIAALNPSYGLSSGWPKARLVGLRRLPYRVVDQGLAQ